MYSDNEHSTVYNQPIKVISSVKLLDLQLDDNLNFEEKKILTNSYFMDNFNYWLLVWMLSSAHSLK